MIKIEKSYKNITLKLSAIFVGNDICVTISGGDKEHIGSISVYSKEDDIKTISLINHKDYIIGEMFLKGIKDFVKSTVSVSCGIHIDDITKEQIDDIYKLCNIIIEEFKNIIIN